jgi:hypothetical protein
MLLQLLRRGEEADERRLSSESKNRKSLQTTGIEPI